MARLVSAILDAARSSGGLVDATLVGELERAGYASTSTASRSRSQTALRLAPPRAPAGPSPDARWREVRVDAAAGTVTRPAGHALRQRRASPKGLFGDILAGMLGHARELRDRLRGGRARRRRSSGLARPVQVASPFDDSVLHTFELVDGAAATSGIGRRSWLDAEGRPAHHLLDPASGRPAFTGLVQVTALAPTASRPRCSRRRRCCAARGGAAATLRHGGVVVDRRAAGLRDPLSAGTYDVALRNGATRFARGRKGQSGCESGWRSERGASSAPRGRSARSRRSRRRRRFRAVDADRGARHLLRLADRRARRRAVPTAAMAAYASGEAHELASSPRTTARRCGWRGFRCRSGPGRCGWCCRRAADRGRSPACCRAGSCAPTRSASSSSARSAAAGRRRGGLRIVACDYASGERVVFDGADGAVTPGEAVAASCAIPAFYAPVRIGGRRYIDGGIHSHSNARPAGRRRPRRGDLRQPDVVERVGQRGRHARAGRWPRAGGDRRPSSRARSTTLRGRGTQRARARAGVRRPRRDGHQHDGPRPPRTR